MTLQSKFDAAYQNERKLYRQWTSNTTRANHKAWLKARDELKQAYDLLHKADATQSEKAEKK